MLELPVIYKYDPHFEKRFHRAGVFEYCAPARTGKTTLEVSDLLLNVLEDEPDIYRTVHPEDVWTNFPIDINGINCTDSEGLAWVLEKIKKGIWQHKVIVLGEASQSVMARNFKDPVQTKLVTDIWQWPKKDVIFMYESNPGNSVDVIIREGTWYTTIPKYHGSIHSPPLLPREQQYITFDISANYECWLKTGCVFRSPAWIQGFFNSYCPVKTLSE